MRSTACWSSDARTMSASDEPRRGWGNCVHVPDPCTTASAAAPDGRRSAPSCAGQGLPDLAAGDVCPDGGVTSRKLRHAFNLAWSPYNVTMPSREGMSAPTSEEVVSPQPVLRAVVAHAAERAAGAFGAQERL